jgi:hypothetical protein
MPCKDILAILFVFLFPAVVICQVPQKIFTPDNFPESYFHELKKEYGNKKQYPPQIEKQVLIALSFYPELKNIPIIFKTRPNHSSGFTRTTWAGVFEPPRKRHFLIVISDSTEEMLMPLLFKNISFNAQVGLIGHELAHVSDFSTKTTLQLIKHVVSSISRKYVDRFEYNTDAICIAHGLGYQLLEWSNHVRKKMNTVNWDGPDYVHRLKKRERYMNPATIEKRINENTVYKDTR